MRPAAIPIHCRCGELLRATSALVSSAGKQQRGPISKQRNAHLQSVLIEAAKLAPRWNEQLAELRQREPQRGNRNRATLAVARKLVAYFLAVDRSGRPVYPNSIFVDSVRLFPQMDVWSR